MDNTTIAMISLIVAIILMIAPLCLKPKDPTKYLNKLSIKGKMLWYGSCMIGMLQHYIIGTYITKTNPIKDEFLAYSIHLTSLMSAVGVMLLELGFIGLMFSSENRYNTNDSIFELRK